MGSQDVVSRKPFVFYLMILHKVATHNVYVMRFATTNMRSSKT